jgi:hypothetical protein
MNISFVNLLKKYGFNLDEAKRYGDSILHKTPVIIEFNSSELAADFVEKAVELGTICRLIE